MCLSSQHMYESMQVSCNKYMHLIRHIYMCVFHRNICTRVRKFRVTNMCISFVIYMSLLNSDMYESTQVSRIKYLHLCCHTYVSCKATYLHLWCHRRSPQEYTSSVCAVSLLSFICLFCCNIPTSVVSLRVDTRVRKFRLSNMYVSFVISISLFLRNIVTQGRHTSEQASSVK